MGAASVDRSILSRGRIIGYAILGGLLFWLIDTVFDTLIFYKGSFLELLILNVPKHEIWIRIAALMLFLLAGFLLARMQSEREQAVEDLLESEMKEGIITEKTYKELKKRTEKKIKKLNKG